MGWWTVTSLEPSGNVPSTWTSVNHGRHAGHDLVAAQQLAPQVHQFGDTFALPDKFEQCCGDERDGFGMIQAQAASEPFLRKKTGLVEHQFVNFAR